MQLILVTSVNISNRPQLHQVFGAIGRSIDRFLPIIMIVLQQLNPSSVNKLSLVLIEMERFERRLVQTFSNGIKRKSFKIYERTAPLASKRRANLRLQRVIYLSNRHNGRLIDAPRCVCPRNGLEAQK